MSEGIGLVKGVESSERQQQVQVAERKVRPQKTQPLNCPRCDSTNTKFCYYNNYSLSQPRYFCKTCRRYWTEGGTLRNVPVGGGSRKNKRSSSSTSPSITPTLASSTTPATKTSLSLPSASSTNPLPSHELNHLAYKFGHGSHDLNLSFPNHTLGGGGHEFGGGSLPAFELLRSGIFPRGLGPFVSSPMPPALGPLFGPGLGFQDLIRPPPSNMKLQPLDGVCGSGYGAGSMQEGGDGRLLFPFEDLKLVPMRNESHEAAVHGQGDQTLFWNGVMGNGGGSSNEGAAGGSW